MFGGKRRYGWWRPLAWVAAAIASVLVFLLLSKILLVLAYLSGGLLIIMFMFWLLWRWW